MILMNNLWYEKYRPATLDDYVWTSSNLEADVRFWVEETQNLPHLIFYGPSGTGKTTLAKIIKNELHIQSADYLLIPASRKNGVDDIREVAEFCEFGGWSGLKIVLFDEAEKLSRDAQEALRNVLDENEATTRFFFTCNDINRIIKPLKSRIRAVALTSLDEDEFIVRLCEIAQQEGYETDDDLINTVIEIKDKTYPDLRKAIDSLQYCLTSKTSNKDIDVVKEADWEKTIEAFLKEDSSISKVREVIISLRDDQITEIFKYLYTHSGRLFSECEEEAIIMIADHLYKNSVVTYPDINLMALLVTLNKLMRE